MAAREAKNRFGQLIDDAQREPVTIEKNGRPIAVVLSLAEFESTEAMKLELLRRDIADSDADLAAGRFRPLNQQTLDEIKAVARRRLTERRSG
jgi:prevent-host-death family protein